MAHKIIMPKQGLQMTEGILTRWIVTEGQPIKEGEPFFEMETDKLSITIDATASGTVLKLLYQEGDVVPVATTIAIIGEPGEDFSALLDDDAPTPAPQQEPAPVPAPSLEQHVAREKEAPAKQPPALPAVPGRVFSTPRARMRAEACGLDIARVHGTGPDGLVIERDVLAAEASSRAVGQVQRAGAPAADAYYVEVDMQQCMQMRTLLREAELPVAFSDLLVCCAAKALARFPALNAALGEDGALEQRPINIGLLVALEEDAPAVVIPQADRMCLADISDRVHALVQRAADGSLDDEDRQGDTFTIANAGILGVDGFVTTSRNAALCAGRIKWRAVVVEGGAIEARPTMWLSLTCDPRVVSGTIPARFLATVKTMLESPALLLA